MGVDGGAVIVHLTAEISLQLLKMEYYFIIK